MQFSSSLVLADMDYIAPSQACIKPAMTKGGAAQQPATGTVYRHGDADKPPPEVLKISLQDCLACSGCVTSAETMLVTSQSRDELVDVARRASDPTSEGKLTVVVSVSVQAATSIAGHLGIDVPDAYNAVARFTRRVLHAQAVIDTEWSQAVALRLTAAEYIERVRSRPETLPMIVSSCPGWVCYCEKQFPELLPNLSRVMSPQGIAGSVLKAVLGGPDRTVYHISIQPCFDRKLEAARDGEASTGGVNAEESGDASNLTRYTDCVLSTHELLEWMTAAAEEGAALDGTSASIVGHWGPSCDAAGIDWIPLTPSEGRRQTCAMPLTCGDDEAGAQEDSTAAVDLHALQGSGGYHTFVLQEMARALYGVENLLSRSGGIAYETKRNANHRIVRTPLDGQMPIPASTGHSGGASGAKQHLFCVAYGFQHIQNIVRGMRKRPTASTPAYTFIELMACPGGCLNGGGQIRVAGEHEVTLNNVRLCFHRYLQSAEVASGRVGPSGTTTAEDGGDGSPTTAPPPLKAARTETGPLASYVTESILAQVRSVVQQVGGGGVVDEQGRRGVATATMTTVFHDRKKEMEAILNANPLHSLKW